MTRRRNAILAILLLNGAGAKADPVEAAKWFRAAAVQGDVTSQLSPALLHMAGQGVPQDWPEAYLWLSAAMAQGNSEAESHRDELLGKMSAAQIFEGRRNAARGIGRISLIWERPRSTATAQEGFGRGGEWFRTAATNGPEPNSSWPWRIRRAGREKDDAEAGRWFSRRAEQGHITAQYRLGLACAEGRGVRKPAGSGQVVSQGSGGESLPRRSISGDAGAGAGQSHESGRGVGMVPQGGGTGQRRCPTNSGFIPSVGWA
jgi:TPR repeat protein